MTYRRRTTSQTWHWQLGCSKWPEKDYVQTTLKPKTGTLCGQCMSKDKTPRHGLVDHKSG